MRLADLSQVLAQAHEASVPAGNAQAWDAMAEFLYAWDAFIQDRLASGPFGAASSYQLGRSLAETYWDLDPGAAPDTAGSWEFLLVVLCVAIVALAAAYVLVGRGTGHTLAAAVAVVSSALSGGAGVLAPAKNVGQGVLDHQRAALFQEAVDAAATLRPPRPVNGIAEGLPVPQP